MTVLLLTTSSEHFSPNRVAEALARRGVESVRIDLDCFPSASLRIGIVDDGDRAELHVNDRRVTPASVWVHRRGALRAADVAAEHRAAIAMERELAILDALGVARCLVINPWLAHQRVATHKQFQMRVARAVGLSVVPTLMTTIADDVRAFAAQHGPLIAKMLAPERVPTADGELGVFTNLVSASDLESLEGLELCPMLFQPLIPKAYEVRATVVGSRVLPAALWVNEDEATRVDARRTTTSGGLAPVSATRLPDELTDALVRLTRGLGLVYAAIDLICSPDGSYHFLEVNPGGQFGWLDDTVPIADAIAAALVGEAV